MPAVRRYLHSAVEHDLNPKMVFVGGPRQVGKTELGKMVIADPAAYLNFDIPAHRAAILRGEPPPTPARPLRSAGPARLGRMGALDFAGKSASLTHESAEQTSEKREFAPPTHAIDYPWAPR